MSYIFTYFCFEVLSFFVNKEVVLKLKLTYLYSQAYILLKATYHWSLAKELVLFCTMGSYCIRHGGGYFSLALAQSGLVMAYRIL